MGWFRLPLITAMETGFQKRVRRIIWRGRAKYLALLATFLGCLLLILSERFIGSRNVEFLFPILIVTGMLATFGLNLLHQFSRCPRCGRLFFLVYGIFGSPFRRSCVHCGLRLSTKPQLSPAERKILEEWTTNPDRSGIPDVGLFCETCQYPLAGLTSNKCPECGSVFELDKVTHASEGDPRFQTWDHDSFAL